jgi:hypothetical protein
MAACALSACNHSQSATGAAGTAADCQPEGAALVIRGEALPADAKTYRVIPFSVGAGTGRVELSYEWTDRAGPPSTLLTATTLDLGLWDEKGYRAQDGFRGWGGSRQGRSDRGQPPVFVEAGAADRGFTPGPIHPGIWHAELGIAAVSPQGADWLLKIECKTAGGTLPAPDPVDRTHIARATPGWYHGDFHMHAYHSNPQAPDWDAFVAMARAVKLDFLMVTEYVTGRHWDTLGAVQRAHPDLILWPGREVITYSGHVNTLGETPGLYEYRHGFEDIDIGWIQVQAKARGALFQVNHPTFFPGPVFENFCRGCEFQLGDRIDWDQVDTIEILTGPVLANCTDLDGSCPLPGEIENPFLLTALDLWHDRLLSGHKITAVSGSDSKGVESDFERRGYGTSATAVYAENLSRAALTDAIQAGRAYVRTRGVERSPALEFHAIDAGGNEVMFGGTLHVAPDETVTLRTTVTGGAGQILRYVANGVAVLQVPILTGDFTHEFPAAARLPGEGPLGTFWRVETLDAQSRTAIGNPVFLKAPD